MMDLYKFGQRLKAARKVRGWSQAKLAGKSGLVASWISHYESGRRAPSLENLRRLCFVLGASVDKLLGLSAQPSPVSWEYEPAKGNKDHHPTCPYYSREAAKGNANLDCNCKGPGEPAQGRDTSGALDADIEKIEDFINLAPTFFPSGVKRNAAETVADGVLRALSRVRGRINFSAPSSGESVGAPDHGTGSGVDLNPWDLLKEAIRRIERCETGEERATLDGIHEMLAQGHHQAGGTADEPIRSSASPLHEQVIEAPECELCKEMFKRDQRMEINGVRFACDRMHSYECHIDDVPKIAALLATLPSASSQEEPKAHNPLMRRCAHCGKGLFWTRQEGDHCRNSECDQCPWYKPSASSQGGGA